MSMGIDKDSPKKKKVMQPSTPVNLQTRLREWCKLESARVQDPTQCKGKPDIMSKNS
jgi:hypothetical protein